MHKIAYEIWKFFPGVIPPEPRQLARPPWKGKGEERGRREERKGEGKRNTGQCTHRQKSRGCGAPIGKVAPKIEITFMHAFQYSFSLSMTLFSGQLLDATQFKCDLQICTHFTVTQPVMNATLNLVMVTWLVE
jgi:hypothetical protein